MSLHSQQYLGVTIQGDGRWNSHIEETVNKGNRTLGFVRRILRISSKTMKELAYKALVRPCLEYTAAIWDPHDKKHIQNLEKIQRRAARFVCNDYHTTSSVSKMLEKLDWPSLEHRRQETRLVMLRKILDGDLKVNLEGIRPAPTRQRRGHNKQLEVPFCNKDLRQKAFLPRTIREWNGLSQKTIDAPSAASFKAQLC